MMTKMKIVLTLMLGLVLQACGGDNSQSGGSAAAAEPQQTYEWKLVTTWPKNFPALGHAPEFFAEKVAAMSNGRMKIRVYGDGELARHWKYSTLSRLVRQKSVTGLPTTGKARCRKDSFSRCFRSA
jgi:TRAP-type mannitol/chloroaromatic compound transport system substrate-binding protein